MGRNGEAARRIGVPANAVSALFSLLCVALTHTSDSKEVIKAVIHSSMSFNGHAITSQNLCVSINFPGGQSTKL